MGKSLKKEQINKEIVGNIIGEDYYKEILEKKINRGYDIDGVDNSGRTTLMWAAIMGYYNIVEMLINYGVNLNISDFMGHTALMDVCCRSLGEYSKEKEILELLLDNGAETNVQNKYGYTPLMYAVERGKLYSVEKLIEYGIDLNIKDKDGDTALDIAYKMIKESENVLEGLMRMKIIRLLEDYQLYFDKG